ncbi:alpha-L-rhamnosidase [Sinomicrobium pectinilyticum]|uniref:alpha-L-rhamnosidase n=1 Tax=Sinomicrobium pectinilyticum TaxID=1084421 RepID=A0A3N0E3S5_SINP1|nr:family 78 glycoside hydrolase catalytic domain [Sinomicrobium pectinilyticum]RNL82494.1 alpha-L-rhamnosidase [Sinomicrobium pectinilyticum]
MKKAIALGGLYLVIFNMLSCGSPKTGSDISNSEKEIPYGLMIEYLRDNDVAVNTGFPVFSWVLPKGMKQQSAYRILVSSSKEKIENNIGDLWDSKKVLSNESSTVPYKGRPLVENNRYYWKVKLWGEGYEESGYSEIKTFMVSKNGNKYITTLNKFQVEEVSPGVIEKLPGGTYFIDFGKDAFGTLNFDYRAKTEDTLIVSVGEQLKHGRINRNPQGSIRYREVKIPVSPSKEKYELNLSPDERNTGTDAVHLPDSFPVLIPFRYAEVENYHGKLSKQEITQKVFYSYFEDNSSEFSSSDTTLNQVWDLCKYSVKATSFAGIYIDGDRERISYEADAYINQLSHYSVDREYSNARRTIEHLMENPTWPTEWQLHMALMFYQDYMYTGNPNLIKKYYDKLKNKTLMELAREDGLITTHSEKVTDDFMKGLGFRDTKARLNDIVDWPPAQKDTGWKLYTEKGERDGYVLMPINTVVNCFYYENLRIMSFFAGLLGKKDEAIAFKNKQEKVYEAINKVLFDEEKKVYIDGEGTTHSSLHANMLALAFNIVPGQFKNNVVDFIKSRGMACSVYGAQYLLEGLYNANEADYALDLLTSDSDRSWYNMIKAGSTITLEAWDMKYKPNADWNHAWGAAPANIIPRGLWGIIPTAAGFSEFSIKPRMSRIESTQIKVPTIKGAIIASYKKTGQYGVYNIEIPGNTLAYFNVEHVPLLEINMESTMIRNRKVIRLKPGKHKIKIKLKEEM